ELKGIVKEAEESSARKYLPEVMEEVEKLVSKLAKAVKLAHYDVALKLFPQAFELANYAKEASRKKKLPEIAERKYLYGIIPAPKKEISFGNIGIGNSGRVYTLNYKDLAAVVSDTPQQEYSVTEEYSKAHERVITEILKKHSVVPAAFGQVFKNQKILRVLMKKAYKALKECSKLVDNKVELGVKAVISKEALDERKEEMFKRGEEIFKGLSESAVEVVKGRLFSNRLILNASFLVNKDKIKNFSKEVGMISEKYKDLKLKYSGPWAPYSFACIKISAKGIEIGRGR
ncbi:MAG: GvpL/GvpF family gas vesicle protein, partial [Candidatus Thermoplasmatota archaeon]